MSTDKYHARNRSDSIPHNVMSVTSDTQLSDNCQLPGQSLSIGINISFPILSSLTDIWKYRMCFPQSSYIHVSDMQCMYLYLTVSNMSQLIFTHLLDNLKTNDKKTEQQKKTTNKKQNKQNHTLCQNIIHQMLIYRANSLI